jgi:hypothetical protein
MVQVMVGQPTAAIGTGKHWSGNRPQPTADVVDEVQFLPTERKNVCACLILTINSGFFLSKQRQLPGLCNADALPKNSGF